MKRIKLICGILLSIIISFAAFTVAVGAEGDAVPHNLISSGAQGSDTVPVSYGLDVIAASKEITVTGISGNPLYFSAERFACAMNLSRVDYITVTSLPSTACGGLYIGSEGVSVGQKIKAADLALMTYEESGAGGKSSFDFSVNGSSYVISCNIYMIDEINYSPTLTLASFASLNAETYRGVKTSGVLTAHDPEGDELTYEIVKYPENGRVVLNNEKQGTYTYYPNGSFTGEDSFLYVVYDKYGNYSESARVSLKVSAPAVSTVYRDLIGDALYCHAISVTESGLMNGVQVGDYFYFEADREVSRAEFVVTAMNAIGIKNVPDVDKTVFYDDSDISPEMKGYIALAYSKGYISGINENGLLCFNPDESIKMSEAAVIISNMIGYAEPKVTPVFADANEIPSWSGKAIESLHTLGILELPDMTVGANETVTRGDMAKLLSKTMFVID